MSKKDTGNDQVVSVTLDDLIALSHVVPKATGDIMVDAGVTQRTYPTKEVAKFFGKSIQWVYYVEEHFTREDGSKIEPIRAGNNYRLWTLDHFRDIAIAMYMRAKISEDQLRAYLKRIVIAEAGGDWSAIAIPGAS